MFSTWVSWGYWNVGLKFYENIKTKHKTLWHVEIPNPLLAICCMPRLPEYFNAPVLENSERVKGQEVHLCDYIPVIVQIRRQICTNDLANSLLLCYCLCTLLILFGSIFVRKVKSGEWVDLPKVESKRQGWESSDFNLISDFFCSSQNPIFRLLMKFKYIENHLFSGIADYFRLFLTYDLTRLKRE